MNSYFFGAGKLGKYWLNQWRDFGIAPKGIFDNNKNLWSTMWNGVKVYSPSMITTLNFDYIFITCGKEKDVFCQLLDLGITEKQIVAGYHNIRNYLFYHTLKNNVFSDCMLKPYRESAVKKIIFDLQNGMGLGGVEAWSYELAGKLKRKGWHGIYLATDTANPNVKDETYPVYTLAYRGLEQERDKINLCVQEIINHLPCTIICNFPQHIFWSACIAKSLYPQQIRIIAVQHNDDPMYYEAYSLWQDFIDRCMTISTCMKQKMLLSGMDPVKIDYLEWQIPCKKSLKRKWSIKGEQLQIGYAGRVTIMQKRVDLFLELAKKLKERAIDVRINIVGTGDYSKTLDRKIQEEKLCKLVVLLGYMERKNIRDFWSRQDIMVSCSEWEGHSISQSEAMAEGAVPVITDVSGARDDVADGCNGYVVEVGNIEAIACRIQELYYDRNKLKEMGTCAHNTIYERQKDNDQAEFWDQLIKKVWQG